MTSPSEETGFDIARAETWQASQQAFDSLEANLAQISRMKAEGWSSAMHIERPGQYFRQYLPVILGAKNLIYVNAFCDAQFHPDWRERFVFVNDGASCYWQALFDPATKRFVGLHINSRG